MKFTFSWLKEHLKTTKTFTEIATALVELGLEVEDVINPADELNGFKVGFVESCEKHPDADRLSVCKVNNGSGEFIPVVCGAPNVRQGLYVAFATPGCVVPLTKDVLKKGKIRGIESLGMICSAKEIGIGDESDGIMELDSKFKPGTDLATYFKLDDVIFDISITPNRADCFSVRGIARDLAAKSMGEFIETVQNIALPKTDKIDFSLDAGDACSYFSMLEIADIENKESPLWLKKRLEDCGQNSISALVDITNYVMYDLGQPLHAFDADNLKMPIAVRLANESETLKALDENIYTLNQDLIVADAKGPIALAGVKGGHESGVSESTTRIYLESAYFNPINITKTGQKFNLFSDARARFERGIDASQTQNAMKKAAALILEVCGGHLVHYKAEGILPLEKTEICLTKKQLHQKTGQEFSNDIVHEIFKNLGFESIYSDDVWQVKIPTHRHDLTLPENLIEEILRLHGYSEIPYTSLPLLHVQERKSRKAAAKKSLQARGLDEVYTFSMIDEESARLFANECDLVHLLKPLTLELAILRPSLLPSLINIAVNNKKKSLPNSKFFEVAPAFYQDNGPKQRLCIAGLRFDKIHEDHWLEKQRNVDVYDAKADMMAVLKAYHVSENSLQLDANGAPNYYHPKRSAQIKQGKKVLGFFGELHPLVLKKLNIKQVIVAFEVFPENLPNTGSKKPKDFSLSVYQPILRDLAFIVDKNVSAELLIKTIKKVDQKLIQDVIIFDVYEGDRLDLGKKSIALRLNVQANDRTLTDDEMMDIQKKSIDACQKIGAIIRDGSV